MSNAPASYADRRSNPLTGCLPGLQCWDRCWARRFAQRHAGRFGYCATNPFQPTVHEDRMGEWKRWRRPSTVALCFMGDAFAMAGGGYRWDNALGRLLGAVSETPQHRFLLLTKRPGLAREWVKRTSFYPGGDRSQRPVLGFPPNLWLGVSCEDQASADERIPILIDTPAAHRWVSIEPQIGPVDLSAYLGCLHGGACGCDGPGNDGTVCEGCDEAYPQGLDWVVQGCESGPGRRPFDVACARSVRDQCKAAGVPYFLKQMPVPACEKNGEDWGAFERCPGCPSPVVDVRPCSQKCDRMVVQAHPTLDGRQHLELPWTP
jgi:protein gp37